MESSFRRTMERAGQHRGSFLYVLDERELTNQVNIDGQGSSIGHDVPEKEHAILALY